MPIPSIGPLPMLDVTDLAFVSGPEIFAPLVNDTLGNAGGPDDGFDSMFNDVASNYADDLAGLSEMDTHINAADFVPGAFDVNEAAPVALDIVTAAQQVDASIGELDGIANTQPPLTKDPTQASVQHDVLASADNTQVVAGMDRLKSARTLR